RLADPRFAHIFVGVQIRDRRDTEILMAALEAAGLTCHDLTDNELAKLHLCHMVGGRLPAGPADAETGGRELLYRFEFPERPGALMAFVTALHPNWNISIFHYRNHGADVGRIVVGVQVPDDELEEWRMVLAELPYQHWEETGNPAYRLFLGPVNEARPALAALGGP
ncbi:MAG: threonine ammonia-lyase, biosynthetic, partial [Cyanobium sp.]